VVTRDGRIVPLTKIEFRLLTELAAEGDRVLSREDLLERVGDYDCFGHSRLVAVNVPPAAREDQERSGQPAPSS
jgi:DNA-binding response OmpR family regulator